MANIKNYFTKFEWGLWIVSMGSVILSYFVFDRGNPVTVISSIMGITSILFNAKGNPAGQAIMLVFCLVYGSISWGYHYFGEVITYMGMTGPIALVSFITWIRNPYKGKKSEVTVNKVKNRELIFLMFLTAFVTFIFYFILKKFGTVNLIISTISIATSFAAVYLTARRDYRFSFVYMLNDSVLIVLWILASRDDIKYISMVICFAAFFAMDCYALFNWHRLKKKQAENR